MATPDIGTTIGDGYQRGIDRIGAWSPVLLPLAVVAGLVSGAISHAQYAVLPDAGDILRAAFSGKLEAFDDGDFRTYTLLGAVGTSVMLVLTWIAYAVLGGTQHRGRHGSTGAGDGSPAVADIGPAIGRLMPNLALLGGLVLLAQSVGVILGTLGSLVGIAAWIFVLHLVVKWIYAPIVAGSNEAVGAAAYQRSEAAVSGSWWGTFGVFIVVVLAVAIPTGIASLIVDALVPTAFLSGFASTVVFAMLNWPIMSCALESAWSQVEEATPAPLDAPQPPSPEPQPRIDEPGSGPFV